MRLSSTPSSLPTQTASWSSCGTLVQRRLLELANRPGPPVPRHRLPPRLRHPLRVRGRGSHRPVPGRTHLELPTAPISLRHKMPLSCQLRSIPLFIWFRLCLLFSVFCIQLQLPRSLLCNLFASSLSCVTVLLFSALYHYFLPSPPRSLSIPQRLYYTRPSAYACRGFPLPLESNNLLPSPRLDGRDRVQQQPQKATAIVHLAQKDFHIGASSSSPFCTSLRFGRSHILHTRTCTC